MEYKRYRPDGFVKISDAFRLPSARFDAGLVFALARLLSRLHGRSKVRKGLGLAEETITLYEAIGGEATVRALAHRFYELMETLPEAAHVRAIHPADLSGSEAKFYDYLTGYLGGPPLYTDKYGHPRLRSRHFIAGIGSQERDEWLLCFRHAMDETIANPKLRDIIWPPIERLAHHMQNRE